MINYFHEFEKHLMEDEKPSEYFNELIKSKKYPMEYPFTMISDLIKTEQNLEYHPEGSVWNHAMLVVDEAAYGFSPIAFVFRPKEVLLK